MADTLDILTEDEALDAINMSQENTDHLAEVAMFVTAISRIIDRERGPVVKRTVTAEVHRVGGSTVHLQAPVVSISLVRNASSGTVTTLSAATFGSTSDGYHIDLTTGRLTRRWWGAPSNWGDEVEVTYVAGRYDDTASVDPLYKACAASILRRLWKREAGVWAQSSEFYESLDVQTSSLGGFFRVAKPIIDEMLPRRLQAIA